MKITKEQDEQLREACSRTAVLWQQWVAAEGKVIEALGLDGTHDDIALDYITESSSADNPYEFLVDRLKLEVEEA